MTVREVAPADDIHTLPAGAQFADAFRIDIDDGLDARHAAERDMSLHRLIAPALSRMRSAT